MHCIIPVCREAHYAKGECLFQYLDIRYSEVKINVQVQKIQAKNKSDPIVTIVS